MALRRQTVLGLTTGSVLVVAIGGLGLYHYSKFDPETVKTDFEPRFAEFNRIPDTDVVRKDKAAEELLANPLYKEHAKSLWLKVERAHRPLHDAAQLDRAAQKDVASFLARCRAPGGDVRTLEAEGRSLLLSYGGTRFREPLEAEVQRLRGLLDSMRGFGPQDYLNLVRDVRKAEQEGRFAAALALLDAAARQCQDPKEYERKFAELREEVKRKAEPAAAKILEQALGVARSSAIERLEKALPDFEGLPARAALEARLRQLKKP